MKNTFLILILGLITAPVIAQKVDSIYFHLSTDSLKKGTHNYISVDGKMSNGTWLPLTNKELTFSSTYGEFEGNDLVIAVDPIVDKVTVKAVLRSDPLIAIERTIWIKTRPDPSGLNPKDRKPGNR